MEEKKPEQKEQEQEEEKELFDGDVPNIEATPDLLPQNVNLKEIENKIVLNEETKDYFLECILEGRPYKQRFKVVDDKLDVLFRTMTLDEIAEINSYLAQLSENTTIHSIVHDMTNKNLIYMLDTIYVNNKPKTFENNDDKTEYIKNICLPLYEQIMLLMQVFSIYVEKLKKEIFSSDF